MKSHVWKGVCALFPETNASNADSAEAAGLRREDEQVK